MIKQYQSALVKLDGKDPVLVTSSSMMNAPRYSNAKYWFAAGIALFLSTIVIAVRYRLSGSDFVAICSPINLASMALLAKGCKCYFFGDK